MQNPKLSNTSHAYKYYNKPFIYIKHYSCRYLNQNTPVYSLVKNNGKREEIAVLKDRSYIDLDHDGGFKDMTFFTAPFCNKHSPEKEVKNVMICFICPFQANFIKSNHFHQENVELLKSSIEDLSYQAHLLKIPMVTILNSYCELDLGFDSDSHSDIDVIPYYDIFFTAKYIPKYHFDYHE